MALHDRILVATDRTAASDRALDRAILLANGDASKLTVVHVAEGRSARTWPALSATLRHELEHDLGPAAADATIQIEDGTPADVIKAVAREQNSTLIVVGVSRTERFGRVSLGTTVDRLMRTVDQPLLLVNERPRAPYAKVGVAIDFSRHSAETVALAGKLFPHEPITVLHAAEPLATYGASDIKAHREAFRQAAESTCADWLETAGLPREVRARIRPQIMTGEPAKALRDAAETCGFDLVILATRGRPRVLEFFLGSIAKRILAELPCDALFVREAQLPAVAAASTDVLVRARP